MKTNALLTYFRNSGSRNPQMWPECQQMLSEWSRRLLWPTTQSVAKPHPGVVLEYQLQYHLQNHLEPGIQVYVRKSIRQEREFGLRELMFGRRTSIVRISYCFVAQKEERERELSLISYAFHIWKSYQKLPLK